MTQHKNPNITKTYKPWVSAQLVASQSVNFNDISTYNDCVYWAESVPNEKNAMFLMEYKNGTKRDLLKSCVNWNEFSSIEWSVATSVHGYGGGSFEISHGKIIFFNQKNLKIYSIDLASRQINEIFSKDKTWFSNFTLVNEEYLFCLSKDCTQGLTSSPIAITLINIKTKVCSDVVSGCDFYSDPVISPNGKHISWLAWNHPHMPWDETELWIGNLDLPSSQIVKKTKLIHQKDHSLYQPCWSLDNNLYVASDKTNFWSIYKCVFNENNFSFQSVDFQEIVNVGCDIGRPQWISGTRTFDFLSSHEIVFSYVENGIWKCATKNISLNLIKEIKLNHIETIYNIKAVSRDSCILCAGGSLQPLSIILVNDINKQCMMKNLSTSYDLDGQNFENVSKSISLSFQSGNEICHAFYYPPHKSFIDKHNPPPAIIKVHGGPTHQAESLFSNKVQFFTSRGFAFIDVNYRGSSGFGRSYRNQLKGQWGVVEVQDVINCALYLISEKYVDENNLFITGSSAGGFSVLSVISKCRLFSGASVHYGISDLSLLSGDIHKFEAFYDSGLIGGSPQQNPQLYKERSPITHAKELKTPLLLFHGGKDFVVNSNQSLKMFETLKKLGQKVEYVFYENEGHGFKQTETIIDAITREELFFTSLKNN